MIATHYNYANLVDGAILKGVIFTQRILTKTITKSDHAHTEFLQTKTCVPFLPSVTNTVFILPLLTTAIS